MMPYCSAHNTSCMYFQASINTCCIWGLLYVMPSEQHFSIWNCHSQLLGELSTEMYGCKGQEGIIFKINGMLNNIVLFYHLLKLLTPPYSAPPCGNISQTPYLAKHHYFNTRWRIINKHLHSDDLEI